MKNLVLAIKNSLLVAFSMTILSCGSSGEGGAVNPSVPPVPYCSTTTTHPNPIVVTGSARYEYRTDGNGAVAAPKPIRHAEIRVTNSEGALIQCGETGANGNFSLSLPSNGQTAKISITSRADNNFVKAYVLQNPTQNTYHEIATNLVLSTDTSVGTLTAKATDTLQGGAFNILDKIHDANDFLRNATATCAATFGCTPFTVAPLVPIYWARGVDPGAYFGLPPLSFYLPDRNELYILGGVGGDVDHSDTDHFDDTIVLHEYAHFLEHQFSITNSPGGMHNGDNILDPRLAWGEAWANYFQAQVTGLPRYRDTFGTPLGTSGVFVNEDLEHGTADTPTELGEGNFREFSITRALIDLTDPVEAPPSPDNLQTSFEELWTLLTATTNGFADTSLHFRGVGLFYLLQTGLAGSTDWSSIQASELQVADRTNYGNTLSVSGAACPTTIQAENVPGAHPLNNPGRQPEDGTPENSNQFKSNDFYQINHGGGALTITLSYTTATSGTDLDLILYKNDYLFGDESTMAGISNSIIPDGATGDTETLSFLSLAAGTYMINVHYNTRNGIKGSASYNLSINGQNVCPD